MVAQNLPPQSGPAGVGFSLGIKAAFYGLGLLFRSPRRLLLCLLPFLIGLGLLGAAGVAFLRAAPRLWQLLIDTGTGEGHHEVSLLSATLFALLSLLILAVLGYLLLLTVVVLCSAPMASRLAAEAEAEVGGPPPPTLTLGENLLEAGRSLGQAALQILVLIGVSAGLALLSLLLPPLLIVTAPLTLVGTCAFLAYDLLDPSLSQRRLPFVEKWRFLRLHWRACFGLALVALAILSLPGLNLLIAPGLSMGGAVLVVRLANPPTSDS